MKLTDISKFRTAIDAVYNSAKYEKIRKDMDRFLAYFRGEFWQQQPLLHNPADSEIFVNYIFSTVMTIMPLLTDNRPTWYVRARKAYTQRYFNLFNDALEYLWDTLECDVELAKVVLISLLLKVGIWKIYFDKDASPSGEIAIETIDPRTFVMAPGYDDIWKTPWCGTFGERPLTWVWDNFPEQAEKVTGRIVQQEGSIYDSSKWKDEDAINRKANVYEIWLKDETIERALGPNEKPEKKYPYGRYVIFTDQKDEDDKEIVLWDKDYKYRHSKPPWVAFYDYWNPFEFHGMSEPDQIETLNLEFNLQLKRLANYCRRFTGLNIYKDSSDGIPYDTFKEEIIKGNDNVWEKPTGSDPPTPITFSGINRTVLEFISALPKLLEEMSGVSDISKGMISKKERQTASEIATLIETSYTRTRQRIRNLENSVKRSCYLFVSMMQQFYNEPRDFTVKRGDEMQYGSVTNNPRYLRDILKPSEGEMETEEDYNIGRQQQEDFTQFFEAFGKDQVYADFDIEIQTNSTLPMDKQSLANLFLRLFEMQAIDQLALLQQLRVPNAEEIVQRLQAAQMPQQGAING